MRRFQKGTIQDGKYKSNKNYFKQMTSTMPDGDYLMILLKISDRTPRESQNYYFTQLGEWSLKTGYSKDELHEIIKADLFVELFDSPVSSSDLDENMWELVFFNLDTFLTSKFENL